MLGEVRELMFRVGSRRIAEQVQRSGRRCIQATVSVDESSKRRGARRKEEREAEEKGPCQLPVLILGCRSPRERPASN